MGAVSNRVTIVNKKGLHARASGKFARLAAEYSSDVQVTHEGETANGEHIMDLLMLAAYRGCSVEIRADGTDAEQALAALLTLVSNGFGELDSEEGETPR